MLNQSINQKYTLSTHAFEKLNNISVSLDKSAEPLSIESIEDIKEGLNAIINKYLTPSVVRESSAIHIAFLKAIVRDLDKQLSPLPVESINQIQSDLIIIAEDFFNKVLSPSRTAFLRLSSENDLEK